MSDVLSILSQLEKRAIVGINNVITLKTKRVDSIMDSPIIRNPISIYEIKEQKFDNIFERLLLSQKKIIEKNTYDLNLLENNLKKGISSLFDKNKHDFEKILSKLEVLNQMLTLKRGYSIVKKDNKVIDKVKTLKSGDNITIELQDGKLSAVIK